MGVTESCPSLDKTLLPSAQKVCGRSKKTNRSGPYLRERASQCERQARVIENAPLTSEMKVNTRNCGKSRSNTLLWHSLVPVGRDDIANHALFKRERKGQLPPRRQDRQDMKNSFDIHRNS